MTAYLFKEHADGSYYGRGPWVDTGRLDSDGCHIFEPTADGFSYSPRVCVPESNIVLFFTPIEEATNA